MDLSTLRNEMLEEITLPGLQQWVHGCSIVNIDGKRYIGLTEDAAHEAAWIVSDGGIKTGGAAALIERLGFGKLSSRTDACAYFTQDEADRLWGQVSGF